MNIPQVSIEKILYTTDLSESGRLAFPLAASLAHQYSAQLDVLHVVPIGPEPDRALMGYMDEKLWDEIRNQTLDEAMELLVQRKRDNATLRKCVGEYCEAVQAETSEPFVTYSVFIRSGNQTKEILAQADEGGYDLLVMASHGHGLFHGSHLGSIAQRVLRRSPVPVLLVPVGNKV